MIPKSGYRFSEKIMLHQVPVAVSMSGGNIGFAWPEGWLRHNRIAASQMGLHLQA
jgi:hypothetical protein